MSSSNLAPGPNWHMDQTNNLNFLISTKKPLTWISHGDVDRKKRSFWPYKAQYTDSYKFGGQHESHSLQFLHFLLLQNVVFWKDVLERDNDRFDADFPANCHTLDTI